MVNEQWIGYTLGKYRINKLLWKKRSSIFYAASDVNTNETVLIKMIQPVIFLEYGQQLLEMLYQNVRTSINIQNPHLPAIYDTGRASEYFYIVMQYLPGVTVDQMMSQTGVIGPSQAMQIAKDVCNALWAGHERGMLHLDIKPRNILLFPDSEEVKLLEFGLAMPIENTGMIGAGKVLLGSSFYIAPEQIRGERSLDPRSDLYSLGANLFHWLVGQPPYQGTNSEILQQHVQASIPSIRMYNPNLPESLDALIMALMQKNPEQRVENAKALENIFHSLLLQIPRTRRIAKNEIQKDLEDFLLVKIIRSEEDKIFIQNTLQAIAESQKKANIPDEVQNLMDKIIIQEFEDRFGSPEAKEMIEKIKQCPVLLQNPKGWVEAKAAEAKSNRQTQSRKLPNISQEFMKTGKMKAVNPSQLQAQPTSTSRPTDKFSSLDPALLDSPKTPSPGYGNANFYKPTIPPAPEKGHKSFTGRSNEIPGLDSSLESKISEGRTGEMPSQAKSQKIASLQGKIPEAANQEGFSQEKPKTWPGKTQEMSAMQGSPQRNISSHGRPTTSHGRVNEPITSHAKPIDPPTSHGRTSDPITSHGRIMDQMEKAKIVSGKSQMFAMPTEQIKNFAPEDGLGVNRNPKDADSAQVPKIIKSSQRSMEAVIVASTGASSGQPKTSDRKSVV